MTSDDKDENTKEQSSEATETATKQDDQTDIKPDFEEKYLRCLAEMENMRKRLLKEQKDFARISLERFVKNILDPIDNLENALVLSLSASEEVKNWLVGFEMIKQQFVDCLASQGVVSYEAKSCFFDPSIHEAVETVSDASVPKGTIIKEFTKGYKMGNKVIRPAKVAVSYFEDVKEAQISTGDSNDTNEQNNLGEENNGKETE